MIPGVSGTDSGTGVSAASKRAEISREQFLQILVTELANQNPLDPMDNGQFLQQLVGLQTLEQTAALTDSLKTFERFLQMSYSAGLIGREVKASNLDGEDVEGKISKIIMEKGKVLLQIGEDLVPASGIKEIK